MRARGQCDRGERTLAGMRALIIDGANVVGSRPDGWWRDRPGAARRLHNALAAADLAHDEVVLVLEGAARRGVGAGTSGGVLVVHAPGSGDDAIVAAAKQGGYRAGLRTSKARVRLAEALAKAGQKDAAKRIYQAIAQSDAEPPQKKAAASALSQLG